MGWFGSSEETNEEKLVDSNGHVNNNIIIQEARDTHTQTALTEQLLVGTYILITLEAVKLAICVFNMWKRQIKKRYNNNNDRNPPARNI